MLQAALNGSRPEDAHPALPVQARHLARDARAVARLGVTSVHVHPRGPDTLETLDPVHVGSAVAATARRCRRGDDGTADAGSSPTPACGSRVVTWGRLACQIRLRSVLDGWLGGDLSRGRVHSIAAELGVLTSGEAVTLRKRGFRL